SLMMGVADFPVEIIKALKPRTSDVSNADTGFSSSPASQSSTSLRSGVETTDAPNTPSGDSNVNTNAAGQRASSLVGEFSNPLSDDMSSVSPSTTSGSAKTSMARAMRGLENSP